MLAVASPGGGGRAVAGRARRPRDAGRGQRPGGGRVGRGFAKASPGSRPACRNRASSIGSCRWKWPITARTWTRSSPSCASRLRGLALQAPALPVYSTVTAALADARCLRRGLLVPERAPARLLRRGDGPPDPRRVPALPGGRTAPGPLDVHQAVPGRGTRRGRRSSRRSAASSPNAGRFWRRWAASTPRAARSTGAASMNAAARYVRLPAYPWQRETYWQESEDGRLRSARQPWSTRFSAGAWPHPATSWQSVLNGRLLPWLGDHRVEDLLVLPGAAYVELGLAIQHELSGQAQRCSRRPGVPQRPRRGRERRAAPPHRPTTKTRGPTPCTAGRDRRRRGASMRVGRSPRCRWVQPPAFPVRIYRRAAPKGIDGEAHYTDMRRTRTAIWPCFQGVRGVWRCPGGGEALARVEAHELVPAPITATACTRRSWTRASSWSSPP